MYLVGVISQNKKIIKSLEKEFDNKKVDFINLDTKTIDNLKNIKFDIILISNLNKINRNNSFKKIISNTDISVINADIKENFEILDNLKGIVITYGFNQKSTITASSVNDDTISICIQRIIEDKRGKKIEPIEYVENIENFKNIDISDVIGIKTVENLLTYKKN